MNSLKHLGPYTAEIILNTGPQTFIFHVWQRDRSTQVGPLRIMEPVEAIRFLKSYYINPPPQSASIQWVDGKTKEYNSLMVWHI